MKTPILYTSKQMRQIQEGINEIFGGDEDGLIAHEITSEYVHTDVQVIASDECDRAFVTFGMGARNMNAPLPDLSHVELSMHASKELDVPSKEAMTIINELVSLSKFPFRNNTWLHHGHTIEATKEFRDTFGFDALAFVGVDFTEIEDIGEVAFLMAIPLYKEEREWIMETNTFDGLLLLEKEFGDQLCLVDSRRSAFVPDEQTLQELKDFLEREQESL